jgi:Glycosyltransferase family 87
MSTMPDRPSMRPCNGGTLKFIETIKTAYKKKWYFSFCILLALSLIYLLCELKNDRFYQRDFHVYYTAAQRIMHGENLYRPIEDGFYHYKYSPVAALFFVPFAVFPFGAAKVLYWFFLSCVICFGFYLSILMLEPGFKRRDDFRSINNLALLSALVVSVHFVRELELGQVNHVLLVVYLCALYLFWKKRQLPCAVVLSASFFLKPFSLIFLPWFFLRKKWKTIGYFLGSVVALGVVSILFFGPLKVKSQYHGWVEELSIELSHKQDLLARENHTVFSLVARYTPLRFTPVVTTYARYYQLSLLLIIGLAFVYIIRKGRDLPGRTFVLEGAFLINLIPLLSFTSHNAFGFVELSVVLMLYYFKQLPRWLKITAIAGMVLSGGNIYDVVGKKLWSVFNDASLVGIGGLVLCISLVFIRGKRIC